ncbi:MAG TPA: c-type cytochrome domain-containing protein [Pedobacter sp.]|uniref:c-type cytochrome domain-containing protein n=1 Tax=Pedobacter sp. TaxID=1411316 RepID=UPI002C599490|nr:c-type cytochrome domain-containing protein [Pedobacter sp.]HMI03648.1 c-type cytochrome domain-containing protein [Pedobacter sp.]
MTLLSIPDFIGRFHPVLVHLPIGILLLGCLFQLMTIKSRFSALRAAVPFIYLLGGLGAVVSSVSGYLLSQSGDYDGNMVGIHQWLGISVSVISLVVYILYRKGVREALLNLTAVVLIVLITLTGHYGGSLTHGSDYLTSALNDDGKGKAAVPPVPNVQQALAYTHMIQPLLKNRCYSCHGADKQKGKLRLDTREFMLKGGEDGKAIIPGSAEESELIKRLLLPSSNEDHMPPKEKPQLTQEEIQLLTWWVMEGADFNKKVTELKQSEKIKPVLLSFQTGAAKAAEALSDVPAEEVTKADAALIAQLKQAGVVVIPVKGNSNYLSASFVTAKATPEVLKLLSGLKKQLVWLNMAGTGLDDNGLKMLSGLAALVRVNLSNTSVTDQGMASLKGLKHLQYINLVATKVTADGVEQLKELKELNSIYLYQTAVNKKDTERLKKLFHKVNLEFGGYIVPTLAKDTTEVKPPVSK